MKKLLIAAFLGLAACGQAEAPAPAETAPAAAIATPACVAVSSGTWTVAGKTYAVQAHAEGDSCPEVVATLNLISPANVAIFEAQARVADVPLSFRAGPDQAQLQEELNAWVQNVAQNPTADSLPAWPAGADKPPHFVPQAARADYEAARAAKRPIFCYPDGAESNACLALDPQADQAVLLGSWTPERP